MTFQLSMEHQMIRDTAIGFFADRAPVAELRRLRDSADPLGFSPAVWREMADMGFAGILVPEELGGTALGMAGAALVLDAIGRNLSATPMLTTGIAGAVALMGASDQVKARWLPELASGSLLIAPALDERPRHAPHAITCRAVPDDKLGYRLTGTKCFVPGGHAADLLVVSARSPAELVLLLADAREADVSVAPRNNADGRNSAAVTFQDMTIAADHVLAGPDRAAVLLDRMLDATRIALAAELLGIAEQSFAITLSYLSERTQFGQPIGAFQALQHRAAHLFSEIEVAKSALRRAALLFDADSTEAPLYASIAKAKCGDAAVLATNEGVQMHGGNGMTDAFDIGLYMKRARAAHSWFGDSAFHADRFAQLSGY